MTISISIENCFVKSVNTLKRADSLRQAFINRNSLSSTEISILKDINLKISNGENVAFLGSNGSGKSSLLKLISNIYPPCNGTVRINGSVSAIIEMGLGMEPELTGRHNIKLLMLYNNMFHIYNREVEQQIIDFSELGDKIDLPVKTYSSGMISRLAFSATIFQNPDILLLDEVFSVGDRKFVDKSLQYMKNKIKSTPITIMVSHSEQEIKDNCNRAILLKLGQIVFDGNVDEAFEIYKGGNY